MSKLSEYRAFAALARAQGQREVASHWRGLAEAEEKRLQWEAEQEKQALDAKFSYADKDIIVEGDSKEFCEEF